MQQHPVLIVGAGPTGMSAAIELARLGVPLRIIDKSPTPSVTSRALAIQARTLELFSQRGLCDDMLRIGNRGKFVNFHSERKQLGRIELSAIPSRFNYVLLLAQNETERLMREHLSKRGVEIERSTEMIAFSQPEAAPNAKSDACITAVLRRANGELEELEAAYLICAEGSHSSVRHTLNLEFKGKSLGQTYALADLHIDGELPEDSLSIFVKERGFLALFPMGGRRFRMIATDPEPHGTSAQDPSLAEMQRLYEADSHIPALLRDIVWTSRFRINSRMLGAFRANRIFFGGDSAHIHSPAGGQGMNTGIQDMFNLGWKLALVYRGHADSALLDSYTEERLPVIQRLLTTTERATDAMTSQGAIAHQLTMHLAPLALELGKVREMGALTVSQVKIEYRASGLSLNRDVAGELRAGDRVPDIDVTDTGAGPAAVPLYSILDPSCFTVLIVGKAEESPAFGELPPSAKVVHIDAAADAEHQKHFARSFGHGRGLYAVRPDAYVGFAGRIDDRAELQAWLTRHFFSRGM